MKKAKDDPKCPHCGYDDFDNESDETTIDRVEKTVTFKAELVCRSCDETYYVTTVYRLGDIISHECT